MPFVNELVSDADIDKYNLPFQKGRPRYWTHDRETERYLWGGIREYPGIDDIREAIFRFFDAKSLYVVYIEPGDESASLKQTPFRRHWGRITDIDPKPKNNADLVKLKAGLKESLIVYGYDGMENKYCPERVITFGF